MVLYPFCLPFFPQQSLFLNFPVKEGKFCLPELKKKYKTFTYTLLQIKIEERTPNTVRETKSLERIAENNYKKIFNLTNILCR